VAASSAAAGGGAKMVAAKYLGGAGSIIALRPSAGLHLAASAGGNVNENTALRRNGEENLAGGVIFGWRANGCQPKIQAIRNAASGGEKLAAKSVICETSARRGGEMRHQWLAASQRQRKLISEKRRMKSVA
jgi:hypothetical protein